MQAKPVVKRKVGRPKSIKAHERLDIQQYRQQLKFGKYLEDIDTEIKSLRASVKNGKASPAVVGASKAIIGASLSLISKVLPDLRALDHTGNIDFDHQHQIVAPIDDIQLTARLQLWRQQQQQKPPIDVTPAKQAASIVNGILEAKQPAAVLDGMKTKTGELVDLPEAKPTDDKYDFL